LKIHCILLEMMATDYPNPYENADFDYQDPYKVGQEQQADDQYGYDYNNYDNGDYNQYASQEQYGSEDSYGSYGEAYADRNAQDDRWFWHWCYH